MRRGDEPTGPGVRRGRDGSQSSRIENLDGLREKLARASRDGTHLGRVWNSVARRARNAPGDYPWFTPMVALVGGEPQDIENAKGAIRRYLGRWTASRSAWGCTSTSGASLFPTHAGRSISSG